jgi:hypothetical protein
MISKKQTAPQRQKVLTFVSPKVADILFYETVDAQRVGSVLPEYGTPHPDAVKWPNHKLVHASPDEGSQFYRYYYAADRASQDDYNYEKQGGEEVIRTYVIPREDYPEELPPPEGGTPDAAYPNFGFVSDSLVDLEQPLNGVYVAIQRKYRLIEIIAYPYDDNLERNVTVTKTIKPAGFRLTDPDPELVSGGGVVYEVAHGNEFHDVLIKTESGLAFTEENPLYELPTIYSSVNSYPFPDRLDAFTIIAVYAFVIQNEPPDRAFASDFLPLPTVTPPQRGPYKTKIRRFITNLPETAIDEVLSTATKLPSTREEYVLALYAEAGPGLRAGARVRQFQIPETYHSISTFSVTLPDGTAYAETHTAFTSNMAPTTGFSGDLVGEFLVDVSSKPTSADLYEVTASYLVLNGIYS